MDKNNEDIQDIQEKDESSTESSLEKPKVKRNVNYVKTPAREEAFKKAREKRMSNIELRKNEKEQLLTEKNKELIKKKEILENKLVKKNERKLKDEISSLSNIIVEETIMKNKHPKKQKIIVYDESNTEEEESEEEPPLEIHYKSSSKKKDIEQNPKQHPVVQQAPNPSVTYWKNPNLYYY